MLRTEEHMQVFGFFIHDVGKCIHVSLGFMCITRIFFLLMNVFAYATVYILFNFIDY